MKKHLLFLLACLFLMTGTVMAKIVKGRVIDSSDKEPIVGASIFVKSTKQGTITDIEGHFSLEIPDNVKTITVSFVGMTTREVAITPGEMTIELTAESQALDEVVVVAYGTQKKSSITGAITQVRNEELLKRPVTSVTSALEGSTPGITVTGNYGSPGSDPTVLIRGIGTVNGSTSPLYVIDGVPYGGNISDLNMEDIETMSILKDAASAALYGNRASNGVILITTKKSKSERIQFNFKTNQGWYERALPEYERTNPFQFMEVEYQNAANAFVHGGGDRTDKQAILNAVNSTLIPDRLYVNIFNKPDDQLFTLDGKMAADASIIDGYAGDLDWFDQATRKGYRSEYQFSGSGATSKSDYYFSLSYLDENGYMKDSGFDRLTGRMAVNIKPVKWLRAGMSINASHQKFQNTSNGVGDGSSSYSNPFYFCRYMAPIYPVHSHYTETGTVYDNAGTPIQVNKGDYVLDGAGNPQWDGGSYIIYDQNGNPQEVITRNQNRDRHVIWESELNDSRTIRNTLNGIGYLDLVLPYGFTATLKANVNTRNSDYYKYENAVIGDARGTVSEDGSISGRNGALAKTLYTYKNWTLQEQLRWNMTYNDRHNIEVLLGHENYSYRYDYTYTSKTNEAFPNRYALSNFSEMASISGYKTRYRTESYLARVQYGYDNRYNIEASFRRDGSSRFAKESRWGNFGSLGANWVFSNEEFMKKYRWLNQGKLRASWGQVGNDSGSGYYAYYGLYGSWTQNSKSAYVVSQNPARDLHWETGESWGAAVEGRLFNRLNLSVEYFDKRNKDLIFSVYAPSSAGGTSTGSSTSTTDRNIGTISNRGWEISADFDIVKSKDWTVSVSANLTTTKNKIVKLPEQNKKKTVYPIDPSGKLGQREDLPVGITSGSYLISEGKSRYDYYTYHWAGVDEMDGQSLYEANLNDYYIVLPDGSQLGGKQKLNDEGELMWDANGNPVQGATELAPENYRLINGKYYVLKTTYAQKKWAGSALPTTYGSFSANIRWKNINISAMFTYSLGGKIYDSPYSSLMTPGQSAGNYHVDLYNNAWRINDRSNAMITTYKNAYDDAYNAAIAAGQTTSEANYAGYYAANKAVDGNGRINPNTNPEINNLTSTDNNAGSDRWLVSRNYLCFKNLNISYTLPKRWTAKVNLSTVRFLFSAENIYLWSARKGMNPMMGIGGGQSNYLVPARVFTFGINATI